MNRLRSQELQDALLDLAHNAAALAKSAQSLATLVQSLDNQPQQHHSRMLLVEKRENDDELNIADCCYVCLLPKDGKVLYK